MKGSLGTVTERTEVDVDELLDRHFSASEVFEYWIRKYAITPSDYKNLFYEYIRDEFSREIDALIEERIAETQHHTPV